MDKIDFGVSRNSGGTVAERLAARQAAVASPSGDAAVSSQAPESETQSTEPTKDLSIATPMAKLPEDLPPEAYTYFRAPYAKSSFIMRNGQRILFGEEHPGWYITQDPDKIEFLRECCEEAMGEYRMQESDIYAFNAATVVIPEFLPFPGHEGADKE